ncbi:MAG TPA: gluconate 2-dehydrogenase subunit 3 family protein [Gemmatimonadales bacterium]|nr:gluconate 2-dehydrogenase subunit 3 family protein [Gemmatimonadales bacterium]
MTHDLTRREALELTAVAALTTAFRWTPADARRASDLARAARQGAFQAKFFTPHEWETVRVLVDIVIPSDERSGSATDAGVPEFMDFMMNERDDGRIPMRGGLAWLDTESRERFNKAFKDCVEQERQAILDDIAFPKRAKPEYSQGVAFFNMFRDLTASGFWSSKIGIADLDYRGNEFVTSWTGCPEAALKKLDVRYGA